MIKFNKSAYALLSLLSLTVSANALAIASGNPATALVTVYGVAISPNADCSNAVVLNYNANATPTDFKQTPQLFTGNPNVGTYQCVVLIMSDQLTFTPSGNIGTNCVSGTSYSRVVCSGTCGYTSISNLSTLTAGSTLTYGSTVVPGGTSQTGTPTLMPLFISTGTSGNGGGGLAFQQPIGGLATTAGIALSGAFVVPVTTGTFVVDFDGQIRDQTPCDLGPPTFTFRSK